MQGVLCVQVFVCVPGAGKHVFVACWGPLRQQSLWTEHKKQPTQSETKHNCVDLQVKSLKRGRLQDLAASSGK